MNTPIDPPQPRAPHPGPSPFAFAVYCAGILALAIIIINRLSHL